MLRRAVTSLFGAEQRLTQAVPAAFYATASTDYAIAIKQAGEITNATTSSISSAEAGYTTGVPLETFNRKVRIYLPARTASQQGIARAAENAAATPLWKIEFDTMAKWANPLMGWTSTADPLENVARTSLAFYTRQEAEAFCLKHGWQYTVEEPNRRRTTRQKRYAAYGDNFGIKRNGVPDLSTLRSNREAK